MQGKFLILLATGVVLVSAPAAMAADALQIRRRTGATIPAPTFVRDLNGVPCGQDCSLLSQARWVRARHCVG
jgi:hypothetical protein